MSHHNVLGRNSRSAGHGGSLPLSQSRYGLALGLGYIPAVVVVGHYFHRFRPFASGVTVAGGGLGMIAGPPFVRMVLDHYGLGGTFLILGGISSHFCAIGLLMRVSPVEADVKKKNMAEKKRRKWTNEKRSYLQRLCCKKMDRNLQEEKKMTAENNDEEKSITEEICDTKRKNKLDYITDVINTFTKGSFVCFVLSIAAWNAGESATLVHFPNYIQDRGFSKQHAASLYIVMGLANIPSRLLTGFAANDENISGLSLFSGQMGLAAILTMTFPLYSDTYGGQLLYVIGLGLYISGVNSLMNPITVELLGLHNLATGFGIVMLMAGVGYLSGAPIAGMIMDTTGTYTLSYIFAGSLYLMSSVFALLCAFMKTSAAKTVDHRNITVLVEDTASRDVLGQDTSMLGDACTDEEDARELDVRVHEVSSSSVDTGRPTMTS
ncbi:monocarboxylate transporter 2-like isoform X2 [Gigantopelta aegis]|uniref:monocarboxylate transporter 2-like isoform X2 n=1 Tax=Gigantopelta aegis TaxID=1735272 RepID=UPI001B88D721|nr:monocarboxylate transporter 2-like isoform X2 [Gigantopelta aegis]